MALRQIVSPATTAGSTSRGFAMNEKMRIPVPAPRKRPAKISDSLFNRPNFLREAFIGKYMPRPASGTVEVRIVNDRAPAMAAHWTEHSSYSGRASGVMPNMQIKRQDNT